MLTGPRQVIAEHHHHSKITTEITGSLFLRAKKSPD